MSETAFIQQVDAAIADYIQGCGALKPQVQFSVFLTEKFNLPYDKISRRFSKAAGKRLEAYMIEHKIETAKTLLASKRFTLSEIADLLGYSSVQYLSNQFKSRTGITVSQFKRTIEMSGG